MEPKLVMKYSRIVAPSSLCSYLPGETARFEYGFEAELTAGEYMSLIERGWRRFGRTLFRPRCRACSACQSLRVDVARFEPDRSQRRAWKTNEGQVQIQMGKPSFCAAKFELYHRYHAYQSQTKDWPAHEREDLLAYAESFLDNPFPTEEWCYFLDDQLIGVGFVDPLPAGLSAIYCYYDPELRHRSLGTFNVLCQIEEARKRGLPHVYLGYYVAGCGSLRYKARFARNEVVGVDGIWREFQNRSSAVL
jgi:leucyl-tRNA---protein transferase